MVKKNLVLFGANSEFARAFSNLAEKQGHSVFGISRTYIDNLDINNQFKAEQNYENVTEIEKFISNIDDPYIIFFNGFLAENRDVYFPTNEEIEKTLKINYLLPLKITNQLIKLTNINKFIYISSMAAVKPRRKNYIYGLSKRSLEESIKKIKGVDFLIIRFGQIDTNMSKDHKKAPFSYQKDKASNTLLKKIEKNGVIFANIYLFMISILLRLLPSLVINYLEKQK